MTIELKLIIRSFMSIARNNAWNIIFQLLVLLNRMKLLKKKNLTLEEVLRTMLLASSLQKNFWAKIN